MPGFDDQANSEYMPDLDYDDIDLVDDAKGVDCVTEHLEMEQPEGDVTNNGEYWKDFDIKHGPELNEALSQIPVVQEIEEVKSEAKAESEHTPINEPFFSNEIAEAAKYGNSFAQSKELLREKLTEKIDDSAHVRNCLNRKDVVVKSILRSMRKYYADLVQDNSEYKRKIRNIKLKHKTLVCCCIDLAKALSLSDADNNVAFYLTAIAFPTDLRKILIKHRDEVQSNSEELQVGLTAIDKIENAMTRYSKKVMNEFMKIPEICLLLLNYLSKVKNEDYKEHYKFLKELANTSLESYSKTDLSNKSSVEGQLINLIK